MTGCSDLISTGVILSSIATFIFIFFQPFTSFPFSPFFSPSHYLSHLPRYYLLFYTTIFLFLFTHEHLLAHHHHHQSISVSQLNNSAFLFRSSVFTFFSVQKCLTITVISQPLVNKVQVAQTCRQVHSRLTQYYLLS